VVFLLAFACGCGLVPGHLPKQQRVYVDLHRLVSLHPGAPPLRELDAQIHALADLAGVKEELPPLAVPPPVPLLEPPEIHPPSGGKTTQGPAGLALQASSLLFRAREAGEKHLEALGRELAEARTRKSALRREELVAALEEEMRAEEARAQEPLEKQEDEILRRFRRRLFNLRANLARKDLPAPERERLQAELREAEAEQQAALAGARRKHQERLSAIRGAKAQEIAEALSRYEAQLRAEDDALLKTRQARMEAELAEAAARLERGLPEEGDESPPPHQTRQPSPDTTELSRHLRAHRARAQAAVSASAKALLSELANLRAARSRLWEALLEEVKMALEEIGSEQQVEFVFDPRQAKRLPDFTQKAAAWLKHYWQSPGSPTGSAP